MSYPPRPPPGPMYGRYPPPPHYYPSGPPMMAPSPVVISRPPMPAINRPSMYPYPGPGGPHVMPPNAPPSGLRMPPQMNLLEPAKTVDRPPVTTVFVGNISDKAPDHMIKQMLNECGHVLSWKRVQGASGKLQAFGFCEYDDPEATLRCIRLLNGWKIADREILVKVDPKTENLLDEYKRKKREKQNEESTQEAMGNEEKDNDKSGGEEVLGKEVLEEDERVRAGLEKVLNDFSAELEENMLNAESALKKEKKEMRSRDYMEGPRNATIDDMDLDNDRKEQINKEIEIFRKRHKDDDVDRETHEREIRMKHRYERERREKHQHGPSEPPPSSATVPSSSTSRSSSARPDAKKARLSPPSSSSRSRPDKRSHNNNLDTADKEDSERRRRMESNIQRKEQAYMERLQAWEARERHYRRQYDLEAQREAEKKREMEIEKQRLLAFFERYDDLRDDQKYYKGASLQRRQRVRVDEEAADENDRQLEMEEFEQLRKRLEDEENPDLEAILLHEEQAMKEHLRARLQFLDFEELPVQVEETTKKPPVSRSASRSSSASSSRSSAAASPHDDSVSTEVKSHPPAGSAESGQQEPQSTPVVLTMPSGSSEQKRGGVSPRATDSVTRNGSKPPIAVKEAVKVEEAPAPAPAPNPPEDPKAVAKAIIERIPTGKAELFTYPILWHLVDQSFVTERIKPWVERKINAYVGEDVPSLTEFICEQVLRHKAPQDILNDITMVLDDEAEVFVMKMWRLLIYVLEAKKAGIDS